MPQELTQAQWASRFLEQLARLQPELTAEEKLVCTKDAFAKAGDLQPELAAKIYALDLPTSRSP